MLLTELFLQDLASEAARTRRVLEQVPEGRNEWVPHPKSMRFGYLAALVATMSGWIDLVVNSEELDIDPPGGKSFRSPEFGSNRELLAALDDSVGKATVALRNTSEEHLFKNWRLLAGGHVASDTPRYVFIGDTLRHLCHHRGQLTVYLRLNDATVPAVYGPSADEHSF